MAQTKEGFITEFDIKLLKDYNNAIKSGTPMLQAMEETMFGASKGAQQMAISANGARVNLEGVTTVANTAKLAMIGLQAAATLANVALTLAISLFTQFAADKINDYIYLK